MESVGSDTVLKETERKRGLAVDGLLTNQWDSHINFIADLSN